MSADERATGSVRSAGARPELNTAWLWEPISNVPSIADFGLTGQLPSIHRSFVDAARS